MTSCQEAAPNDSGDLAAVPSLAIQNFVKNLGKSIKNVFWFWEEEAQELVEGLDLIE